jgi:hypothetical protein
MYIVLFDSCFLESVSSPSGILTAARGRFQQCAWLGKGSALDSSKNILMRLCASRTADGNQAKKVELLLPERVIHRVRAGETSNWG